MNPEAIISEPYLDKDNFWKFCVSFDYKDFVVLNTYYYDSKIDADQQLAKARNSVTSFEPATLASFQLEKEYIAK